MKSLAVHEGFGQLGMAAILTLKISRHAELLHRHAIEVRVPVLVQHSTVPSPALPRGMRRLGSVTGDAPCTHRQNTVSTTDILPAAASSPG